MSDEYVNKFLSKIVEKIINDLSESYCLVVDEVTNSVCVYTCDKGLCHRMVTVCHHCYVGV